MGSGKVSPVGTLITGDDGKKWEIVGHLVLSPEIGGAVVEKMDRESYDAFLGAGDFKHPDREYWGTCTDGLLMLAFIRVQWGAAPERVVRALLIESVGVVRAMWPADNEIQGLALDALSVLNGASPSSPFPWEDVCGYRKLLVGMAPLEKAHEIPVMEATAKAHMMLAMTTILSPFGFAGEDLTQSLSHVWGAIVRSQKLISANGFFAQDVAEYLLKTANIIRLHIVDPPGSSKYPELVDFPELVEEGD